MAHFRFPHRRLRPAVLAALLALLPVAVRPAAPERARNGEPARLERIRVHPDGRRFVRERSGRPFVVWGLNYDRDDAGRLLEDYWEAEWETVVQDFREMRALGANLVRVHLQFGRFMETPDRPNRRNLERLRRLIRLAEETGLYLDVTGLGCYHKADVPAWYDRLPEAARWAAQARFWRAVAEIGRESPALFCYDLMNEPILPGGDRKETEWLAGELGGKWYVQRISLDLAGRTREEVARAWVRTLADAIREKDRRTPITVGVIPWAYVFPGAKPLFYAPEVGAPLDFVSVHFYPRRGDTERAIEALKVYDVGKPLVVEEMFPLECSVEELRAFVERSRAFCDGWIGFYWGKTIAEYEREGKIDGALVAAWLRFFREHAPREGAEGGAGRISRRAP